MWADVCLCVWCGLVSSMCVFGKWSFTFLILILFERCKPGRVYTLVVVLGLPVNVIIIQQNAHFAGVCVVRFLCVVKFLFLQKHAYTKQEMEQCISVLNVFRTCHENIQVEYGHGKVFRICFRVCFILYECVSGLIVSYFTAVFLKCNCKGDNAMCYL